MAPSLPRSWMEGTAVSMMITDAGHTLREAAEYISEHGWTQGDLSNSEGGVCALGALNCVAGIGNIRAHDAATALWDYLDLRDSLTALHPVAVWNDAPERTAEDVILAMKRAAERFDEQ